MYKGNPGRPSVKTALCLLVEVIIYGAFVVVYFFLVLLFMRDWLKHMYDAHKDLYALIVLPLIVGQAVLLDLVTVVLRKLGWRKEK